MTQRSRARKLVVGMSFFWMLTVILGLSGALLGVLALAYRWPRLRPRHIHDESARKLGGRDFYRNVAVNGLASPALIYALTFGLRPLLVHERPTGWLTIVGQGLVVLALYDFGYYLMHRYLFHQWAWMKRVHSVHHRVRHPNALDSLYMHPLELVCGLGLLTLCTLVVGPVHAITFTGVYAVYSLLNIVVHAGLDLPFFPFRGFSFLARKHDTHHTSMKGGNYASITPLWDRVFGTAE